MQRTDIQMENIMVQCLLPTDQAEFFKNWAMREKKTIAEEVDAWALETKKGKQVEFL